MNCNRCNRLLIARDARIVDAVDSAARIELLCECGAVHSSFIDDSTWIYGLAGDKTPGRLCVREWVRTEKGIIRWLSVSDYSVCSCDHGPREWICRLRLDDLRPWGMEIKGMASNSDWLTSLPFGRWVEIITEPEDVE